MGLMVLVSSGQALDPISLLSECGSECWNKDGSSKNPEEINPGPEINDLTIVRCMQLCFSAKTKSKDKDEKLPLEQMLKIKVASYCGHICYNNNKGSKKALDYCYAGCLGTILQSKHKYSKSPVAPKAPEPPQSPAPVASPGQGAPAAEAPSTGAPAVETPAPGAPAAGQPGAETPAAPAPSESAAPAGGSATASSADAPAPGSAPGGAPAESAPASTNAP